MPQKGLFDDPEFSYSQYTNSSNFPEIRVSGKWLQKLGFLIGDYVRIAYDENMIVIRRIECENNSE